MTAELLNENSEESYARHLSAVVALDEGTPDVSPQEMSEAEEAPVFNGATARQRSVVRAVYGKDPEGMVECLTSQEAVLLLNQAARLYLARLPESRRAEALETLDLVRDFTHGMSLEMIADKHHKAPTTANRAKNGMYDAMRRAIKNQVEAGAAVVTPVTLVRQKIEPALEKVARINPRDVVNWSVLGLCGYMSPEYFEVDKHDKAGVNLAKAICKNCTVREACLDDAITNGFSGGVRGGLKEGELKTARRKQKTTA